MQLVIHATIHLAITELFVQCHVPACNCKIAMFQLINCSESKRAKKNARDVSCVPISQNKECHYSCGIIAQRIYERHRECAGWKTCRHCRRDKYGNKYRDKYYGNWLSPQSAKCSLQDITRSLHDKLSPVPQLNVWKAFFVIPKIHKKCICWRNHSLKSVSALKLWRPLN